MAKSIYDREKRFRQHACERSSGLEQWRSQMYQCVCSRAQELIQYVSGWNNRPEINLIISQQILVSTSKALYLNVAPCCKLWIGQSFFMAFRLKIETMSPKRSGLCRLVPPDLLLFIFFISDWQAVIGSVNLLSPPILSFDEAPHPTLPK